jgi:hypothetical protein
MYIILLIFLVIIISSQYKQINKQQPKNIEILQYNNPNKEQFEKTVSENQPCVFTNVLDKVELTKGNIRSYFDYYLPHFCLEQKYEIMQNKPRQETRILKQTNYRFIIYQIKGQQKLILFPPKDEKNLYVDKRTKNVSNVNFWKLNPYVYPKFNDVSYLEIVLRPRQMVVIPPNWWYTIKTETQSNALLCKSESIFSKLLKKSK